MKKTFLKTLVATAVVAATVAISSAIAFAADYTKTYTFGTNNASLSTDSKDFFTINAAADSAEQEDYYTLKKNSKIAFTIPDDATNISIEVNGVAQSSTSPQTIKLINSKSSNGAGGATKLPAADSDPATMTWDDSKYVTGANTVTCTGAAINYYYITVKYSSESGDKATSELGLTTVTNGAVYVTDTDTYVIAGVSKNDIDKGDVVNVTIGNTVVSAGSIVYQNVAIDDTTTVTNTQVGTDYIVAVKVAGANKDAKVEDFSVAVEDAE
jgi:uncharacterized protein YpmB